MTGCHVFKSSPMQPSFLEDGCRYRVHAYNIPALNSDGVSAGDDVRMLG